MKDLYAPFHWLPATDSYRSFGGAYFVGLVWVGIPLHRYRVKSLVRLIGSMVPRLGWTREMNAGHFTTGRYVVVALPVCLGLVH